jgi:hypothetical protein
VSLADPRPGRQEAQEFGVAGEVRFGALARLAQIRDFGSVRLAIKDEFTKLRVSRQRKYQLRMRRDGRCTKCGEPTARGAVLCLKHLVEARERARRMMGWKRRRQGAASYKAGT